MPRHAINMIDKPNNYSTTKDRDNKLERLQINSPIEKKFNNFFQVDKSSK